MFRSSIIMKVKKARYELDIGASKFFGSCDIPASWVENGIIEDDEAFICQVNLEEVSVFDAGHELPESGMLYFFISSEYPYAAHVLYYDEDEPLVRTDINTDRREFFDFEIPEEYAVYYETMNEKSVEGTDCSGVDGIKLLGFPSSISSMFLPKGTTLLMQFDTLESEMGFLDRIDGYLYFAIDSNALKNADFEDTELLIEES